MKLAKAVIGTELAEFEKRFSQYASSNKVLLDTILKFIIKQKGKQMRPMFVLLSARLFGPINDASYRAAALIELLHTATLVHDDVVDDADMRRGFFSVNALWKNKIAVLVGDFLLSKGLLLSLDNDDFQILKIVSKAVKEMSEGELLQIEKARKLDINEEIYFEIIRSKTASLLASACAAGSWTTTPNAPELSEKMRLFGEKLGICFQIKDDLFDYSQDQNTIGKPTGIDIKEKKMTLPLIYTLNNTDGRTRKKIINIVKNHNEDKDKVKEVIEIVNHSGGIEYARNKMAQYQAEAEQLLSELPQNEANDALKDLVAYISTRKS